MITQPTFINNVWYRSAYTLLLTTVLQSGVIYIYLGPRGYLHLSYLYYVFFIVSTSVILTIIGKLRGRETRVLNYIKIYGIFAALPLTVLATSPLYFVYKNKTISVFYLVFFVLVIILFVYQKIRYLSESFNISKSNSVKKNNQIILMKNFSIKSNKKEKFMEPIVSKFVTLASFLIPMGYLISRLFLDLDETGNVTLILIALLASPLSIYSISEFLGGAYIWYHKIKSFEKKSNVEYHIWLK